MFWSLGAAIDHERRRISFTIYPICFGYMDQVLLNFWEYRYNFASAFFKKSFPSMVSRFLVIFDANNGMGDTMRAVAVRDGLFLYGLERPKYLA